MDGSLTSRRGTSPFTARCTTLLACLWGGAAAYILCHSLLVTHNPRYTMAALVSLITVWATLERKRWGRMALIGVSVTTMGVFGFFVSAFSAVAGAPQSKEVRSLHKAVMQVANYYGISLPVTFGLLLLAVVSCLWLCRAEVVAEFNQYKHTVLVTGQRIIATTLVVCWGGAIALNPMLPFQQGHTQSMPRPQSAGPRHNVNGARPPVSAPPAAPRPFQSHQRHSKKRNTKSGSKRTSARHSGQSRKRVPNRAALSRSKG